METRLTWNTLLSLETPWAYLVIANEKDIDNFEGKKPKNRALIIRFIRGKRCQTVKSLFQEWAAALQFPYYFGHNWDAFDECIGDLEWLTSDLDWLPAKGYVFFITYTNLVLLEEEKYQIFKNIIRKNKKNRLKLLIETLRDAAKEWGISKEDDPQWPRPAIPFRIIFHCEPEAEAITRKRLQAAGLDLESLRM